MSDLVSSLIVHARHLILANRCARWIFRSRIAWSDGNKLVTCLQANCIDLVVDVGANVGQTRDLLREYGYSGAILSIEPSWQAHQKLTARAACDPLWSVAERMAVGAHPGTTRLNVSSASDMSSILRPTSILQDTYPGSAIVSTEEVSVRTLDEILPPYLRQYRSVFVKIDTQGSEKLILDGGKESLRAVKGLQLELSLIPLYDGEPDYLAMLFRLRQLGFDPHLFLETSFSFRLRRQVQLDIIAFRPDPVLDQPDCQENADKSDSHKLKDDHLGQISFGAGTEDRSDFDKRRYLVCRTVDFTDKDSWGTQFDLEDEVGYMNRNWKGVPRRFPWLAILWFPFIFSTSLLLKSRRYAGFCVGRYAYFFPIMYRLLGGSSPIVLIDSEWREGRGIVNRLAASCSDFVCCNTREEVQRYAKSCGLAEDKFRFVRMAFQTADICEPSDEGFIFAGGLQGRDWKTLLRAVEGLPYEVRIYTSARLEGCPSNVYVTFATRERYYREMAAASCVVVPLLPEGLRITGTTSFINAMAMGKPVVVTEPHGAPDYMSQGIEGFYCDYGDSDGVRCHINTLMEDAHLRCRMGAAARARAVRDFSPEVHRMQVRAVLAEALNRRLSTDPRSRE